MGCVSLFPVEQYCFPGDSRINDGPKPCFSSAFRTNVQVRWSEALSASSERLVVMVTVVRQMYEAEKSTCII